MPTKPHIYYYTVKQTNLLNYIMCTYNIWRNFNNTEFFFVLFHPSNVYKIGKRFYNSSTPNALELGRYTTDSNCTNKINHRILI